MKNIRRWALLPVAAALVGGIMPVAQAQAATSTAHGPAAVMTITGSAGNLPTSSALVIVSAQLELGRNAAPPHLFTQIKDVPLAVEHITTGQFRVAVPDSAVLREAERLGNGNVNFLVTVDSGTSDTMQMVSAPMTPSAEPGNTAAATILRSRVVQTGKFMAWQPMDTQMVHAAARVRPLSQYPPGIPSCFWVTDGSPVEGETRFGEIHVANAKGMSETFQYITQADNVVSVGFNASGDDWSASGSITVSNKIGTKGKFTAGKKTTEWAEGHVYYQEWKTSQTSPACPNSGEHYTIATHAVGDAFPGNNLPSSLAGNPWHGCQKDPNGYGTVAKVNGAFSSDTGKQAWMEGTATAFGFSFSSRTGFSTDIKDVYNNGSGIDTHVCGSTEMPDVPKLYNSTD